MQMAPKSQDRWATSKPMQGRSMHLQRAQYQKNQPVYLVLRALRIEKRWIGLVHLIRFPYRTYYNSTELNDQEQAYLRWFRVGTSGNDSTLDIPHTLDDETQQDSNITMEYGEGDKGDNGDEGDNMVIKDVTKENKNKNKQNGTRAKVLQRDLASDALAKISKQAVRKAICLLDMFPSDKMFAWEVLEEELVLQQGDDNRILEDLRETKKDPQALDKLLRWTRTLVDPYFGFSSVDEGGPQAELANWLMGKGRYHCEGVDFKEKKSGKLFYSLLIAQILHAFLVDAQNKTTYRLITTELHRLQYLSLYNGACEWNEAEYTYLSKNLRDQYNAIWESIDRIWVNSPPYFDFLEKKTYERMS
ncbi:hypothetical protein BDP27DRAFT_1365564 [Rhodocollybia butyracea]|uniref:DUF6532 domain-containing protein n=1 Tax=Rhodocollybia butyracea TaxID=206335 RepID=A0A9P5PNQ1_9AGAR|nr:hypothetical protein BDP27DRAFT_1365564 [Rhodocollybia butyracea]